MSEEARRLIVRYHDETKHHARRFARSLGYLDWDTQPHPFRSFRDAARVDLVAPFRAAGTASPRSDPPWMRVDFDEAILADAPTGVGPGLHAVSVVLRYSLGLSAWKQAGASRWALRVNPSSGNLHPTEGYVVLGPGTANGQAGVFHYAPDQHALERRAAFDDATWTAFADALPPGAFLAGLASIHWREAWKYGERAFRYCQHDVGHAIAAMSVAAAMIGWRVRLLPGWSSEGMAAIMGVDRDTDFEGAEPEEPACLLLVAPGRADDGDVPERPAMIAAARNAVWTGRASRLSRDRVEWDWIDRAAEATRIRASNRAPAARRVPAQFPASSIHSRPVPAGPASRLILQRRSAVAMDGTSAIDRDRVLLMLRRTLPLGQKPFDALWWTPRLHLAIFIHRVSGLAPGLYLLARSAAGLDALQRDLHGDFAWVRPEGVPEDLPLFLLTTGDMRRVARAMSCTQEIASDGCFTLGMLAEFAPSLDEHGASFYRNLFWEAGAIGQVLYLEAEAAGLRGTGIGCYFDDAVHDLLGLAGNRFQSLYHFTVGGPVDDPRLQTRPGYDWE